MAIHEHMARRAILKGTLAAPAIVALGFPAPGEAGVTDIWTPPAKPDLSTFEGRIAAICEWFDLEPPPLEYDPEPPLPGVVLTEDLTTWMLASGVSMDWLVCGDPKAAISVSRREALNKRQFTHSIRELDETELHILTEAMRATVQGDVPFEVGLEAANQAIRAHRARVA